jgi:hypothetical protein
MFNIIGDGDGKYRIMLGDEVTVGWLNGRAVGFRGMKTETIAREAAIAAWQAMDGVLTNQYAGWPRREPRFDRLRVTHDGAYEWFHDGTVPVARLLRPHRRAFSGTFGIELVLPSYATEGVGVAAAHAISRVIVPFITRPTPDDYQGTRYAGGVAEPEAAAS